MNRVSLVLILHAHQPIGNFDSVLEQNYRRAYLPFIECLERHPGVAVNLHYSGVLLEWFEQHHPEYLDRLRTLREAGSIEFLGGGFYEPILISIPEHDRQAQIAMMQEYLERHVGEPPRGAWLTERVWEPALPETLARAGVGYTLADDTHFLSAGLEPEALYGYYQTESLGRWVRVIPGLKSLRYALPWKPVGETLEMLQGIAESHPDSLVAMGDDLEKFGGWPQTHHWVYEQHWLADFFSAIEANHSWLDCPRASDYLDSHEPLGTVYFPTASYREMTEWTLSGRAAEIYHDALERLPSLEQGEELLRYLNAGSWRNFFSKYSESNLLHKQMLALSERFQKAQPDAPKRAWLAAYRDLLAAQCNDAYWHGVFGGLYAPHLRHGLYSRLLRAEAALEKIEKHFRKHPVSSAPCDWFGKGREALEIRSPRVSCLIEPSDGATVAAIRSKTACANLVNSLRRRPEAYHRKVQAAAQSAGGLASIHDRVLSKEEGLERFLLYDRYDRHAFRVCFFAEDKTCEDFASLRLEESPAWAAAPYRLAETTEAGGIFHRAGSLAVEGGGLEIAVQKEFTLIAASGGDRLRCALKIDCMQGSGRFRLGLEMVLNLLAGHAPDRYYIAGGWKESLDWQGERILAGPLGLQDEWLKLGLDLVPTPIPNRWWFAPVFTVSQSEEGFERVYQGSAILPVWDLELKT
ncbi:MAG: hypothetical protein A3H28_08095, partial [Acidobacteria bacterium RIFCSPLOWO2_02_FULL_61_28]